MCIGLLVNEGRGLYCNKDGEEFKGVDKRGKEATDGGVVADTLSVTILSSSSSNQLSSSSSKSRGSLLNLPTSIPYIIPL